MNAIKPFGSALVPLLVASSAQAIVVPGRSNPWLAGDPDGTVADVSDRAPAQSPVFAGAYHPGQSLSFSVTGSVSYDNFHFNGPNGGGSVAHAVGAENGKSDIVAPINALVGIFLDSTSGSPTPPPRLDFGTAAARNFEELRPLLFQPFYVGDGLRNNGSTAQRFYVPTGATRLFLGVMDGYSWRGNGGQFDAQIVASPVPEPGTMLALGAGIVGLLRRRRRA